jgi:hypothetical protein
VAFLFVVTDGSNVTACWNVVTFFRLRGCFRWSGRLSKWGNVTTYRCNGRIPPFEESSQECVVTIGWMAAAVWRVVVMFWRWVAPFSRCNGPYPGMIRKNAQRARPLSRSTVAFKKSAILEALLPSGRRRLIRAKRRPMVARSGTEKAVSTGRQMTPTSSSRGIRAVRKRAPSAAAKKSSERTCQAWGSVMVPYSPACGSGVSS